MAEGRSLLVATSRLQTQLSRFPSELLDRACAESHLGKLVHCIEVETMVIMATAELELTRVEVDDIQRAWPREPAIQKLKIFNKWQEKKQSEATYRYVTIAINSLLSFLIYEITNFPIKATLPVGYRYKSIPYHCSCW